MLHRCYYSLGPVRRRLTIEFICKVEIIDGAHVPKVFDGSIEQDIINSIPGRGCSSRRRRDGKMGTNSKCRLVRRNQAYLILIELIELGIVVYKNRSTGEAHALC